MIDIKSIHYNYFQYKIDYIPESNFSVSQLITSTKNGATIYSGPPELIMDVPFEMGCYQILNSTQMPAPVTTIDLTPASCIVLCLADAKSFAGEHYFWDGMVVVYFNQQTGALHAVCW